jgi:hypothetical protein
MGETMTLIRTTMSLKQALVLYVLYGIAALLIARNVSPAVRRWRVVRDFAVEVKETLTAWSPRAERRFR